MNGNDHDMNIAGTVFFSIIYFDDAFLDGGFLEQGANTIRNFIGVACVSGIFLVDDA